MIVTTTRIALGRILAHLLLLLLEPPDGDPWDRERSELVDQANEMAERLKEYEEHE